MRMSELCDKIVVNLENGEVLGNIGDADLVIDEASGAVISILLPVRGGMFNRFFDQSAITIPWSAVKKVGSEIMVVELGDTSPPLW